MKMRIMAIGPQGREERRRDGNRRAVPQHGDELHLVAAMCASGLRVRWHADLLAVKTSTYSHHQLVVLMLKAQMSTALAIVSPRLSHSSRVPLCARHIKALMMRLKQRHCHPIEIINSSQTVCLAIVA